MKKLFAAGVMLASVLLNSGAAHAASVTTTTVVIPFEFKVKNQVLPAGHYRLQDGSFISTAFLINQETGQRVEVLRPSTSATPGKAHLIFKQKADGYVLSYIN
jgi:hypothetical protein